MQAIFETVATDTGGNTYTDTITNLQTLTNAYALGYVDSEKLPEFYLTTELVNDGTEIEFKLSHIKNYYPCGYMASFAYNGTTITTVYNPKFQHFNLNGTNIEYSPNENTQRRYINNFYPYKDSGLGYRLTTNNQIQFRYFYYNSNDEYQSTNVINHSISFSNLFKFLNGNYSITSNVSGNTFSFTGTDFEDGTAYVTGNNNAKIRIFITSILTYGVNGMSFTVFGIQGKMFNDDSKVYTVGGNSLNNAFGSMLFTELDKFNPTFTIFNNPCGMHGVFNINIIKTNPHYVYNGNILARRNNSTSYIFERFYPPTEILMHLSYMFKIDVNGDTHDTYIENKTYECHISENDEFLGDLITGDLSDDNFKAQLRPWQYSEDGAAVNDFDPTDIPDYPTPDNPSDPGSDVDVQPPLTEGDSIALQLSRRLTAGSSFITMYNLTAEQLQAFGAILYKSLADYDPHDPAAAEAYLNFFVPLAEELTGTLDIASIVNFVVSVRQYPFSVGTLPDTSVLGTSKIYMGSGKVGFTVGSQVRILSTSISVVDAGECTVVPLTPYNDFRDYYNTTVTCFLPYCGTVELNPIEVIHNTLHAYYAVDFYTGECTAYVTVSNGTHTYLCATKSGVIGVLIPITATNSGQVAARHLADNAQNSMLVSSAITSLFSGISGAATGNVAALGQTVGTMLDISNRQSLLQSEREGRSAVLAPSLSGGSGGAAFMLPDSVYVQIRRGTYDRPSNYPSTCGYPSTISGRLSSFTGYTQCYNVATSGLTATADERAMIKSLLESGVII